MYVTSQIAFVGSLLQSVNEPCWLKGLLSDMVRSARHKSIQQSFAGLSHCEPIGHFVYLLGCHARVSLAVAAKICDNCKPLAALFA